MMTKAFLKAGGAALTLALLTAGATAVQSRNAVEATIKQAETASNSATIALTKHKPELAVRLAEQAVQLRPQDATYRALLGKAYLAAGRFASARQAFGDALQLDGGQAVALNYALATTATGDFAGAQQILEANATSIAPADRGLALALAGNPAAGVDILMAAARAPDASAKVRQNLALTLALAGRWPEARQVALADLSPSDADARIVQWAAFARPVAASDQVASLLGVTPVADQGVPAQLALIASPAQVAVAAPVVETPVVETVPGVAAQDWKPDVAVAGEETPAPIPVNVAMVAPQPQLGNVVFAERREIVQAVPVGPTRYARVTTPVRTTPVAAATKGNFYVQLGAFRGADNARSAWRRAKVRHVALAGRTPFTMPASNGLIRVSVGGFARDDAYALCQTVKADGGVCFVRAGAGDRIASWAAGAVQFAAR